MIILQGARERVESLGFSPDGRMLIVPCSEGLQVWKDVIGAGRPEVLRSLGGACQFISDGRTLVSLPGGLLVVHDLTTGKNREIPLDLPEHFSVLRTSPDGRRAVLAQGDTSRQPLGRLSCRPVDDLGSPFWSVDVARFTHSPPLFLAGGDSFVLFEWRYTSPNRGYGMVYVTRNTQSGTLVDEVHSDGDGFYNQVTSQDGRLISARRHALAAVFRTDDLRAEPVILRNDNRKEFTGLAFHPSGRFLAATSNDNTVKLYDTTTWTVARSFDWDIGRLRSVAFSPDGMLAACGGDKGKIVVWDVDF